MMKKKSLTRKTRSKSTVLKKKPVYNAMGGDWMDLYNKWYEIYVDEGLSSDEAETKANEKADDGVEPPSNEAAKVDPPPAPNARLASRGPLGVDMPKDVLGEVFKFAPSLTNETIRKAVLDYVKGGKAKDDVVKKYGPFSKWDVSKVTDMSNLFDNCRDFNESLNEWDVSKVTDMERMFYYAENFNQPLNKWKTGKVTNMSHMFHRASKFNQPITKWDTSNVTDMNHMFYFAEDFNKPIRWNTSKVTNMESMFGLARSFDQSLNTGTVLGDLKWDVSKVTNMSSMFSEAYMFAKPLDKWDVSSVTKKDGMFSGASRFKSNKIRQPKWVGKVQLKDVRYNLSVSLYKLREKYPKLEANDLAMIMEEYAQALKDGSKTFIHTKVDYN